MKKKVIDNHYILIRKIGVGGFARVYKARDKKLEKFVAIKEISRELSDDATFLDMFRDEAINTAKLEHENIIRVNNFLKGDDNTLYFVMEYINGVDLREILVKCRKDNTKLPVDISAGIIEEVLKALEYAHSARDESGEHLEIVHRDISPGNILINYNGKVKLTDFGIAKAATRKTEHTQKGVLKGKVRYMSPEQAEGASDIDSRSDIFSLGVVFYELLVGKKLFEGDTDLDTWHKVKTCKIDTKLIKEGNVPEQLEKILLKMLEKDKNKRYQTATEVYIDLKKYFGTKDQLEYTAELKEYLKKAFHEKIEEEKERSKEERNVTDEDAERVYTSSKLVIEDELKKSGIHPVEKQEQSIIEEPGHGEESKDEHEKTAFDFVMDTAKKHTKVLIFGLAVVLIGAIVCLFVCGPKESVVEIHSIPEGARISLSDYTTKEMVLEDKKTPVGIEKIKPGNYTLKMEKNGYSTIERIISVTEKTEEQQKIVIPFETNVMFHSTPEGAVVYINGKILPGETPITQTLDLGKEYWVRMELTGFESLGYKKKQEGAGQFILNLSKDKHLIDKDYWSYSTVKKEGIIFHEINAQMFKYASVITAPPGASIYIDDNREAVGLTPSSQVKLKAGSRNIRLQKLGFTNWSQSVNVTAAEDVAINAVLHKEVTFHSYEDNERKGFSGRDINARVIIRKSKVVGGNTPSSVSLPLGEYTISFRKHPDYIESTRKIVINEQSNDIYIELDLQLPELVISVTEMLNDNPVENAYIVVNENIVGNTDSKGVWDSRNSDVQLTHGENLIQISTSGQYPMETKSINLVRGRINELSFELSCGNTISVDTWDYFVGARVYLGDRPLRNDRIDNLPRGKYIIRVTHEKLLTDASYTVTIKECGKHIRLRMNSIGDIYEDVSE